jgi:hypothetical protein
MEKQDILEILDSLDVQISMGKIDQGTYDGLRQKWIERLQVLESGGAVYASGQLSAPLRASLSGSLSVPSAPAVEVLACPKCAAPAEIDTTAQDLTKPIKCLYCDTVYTFRQSQDNALKLKQELKAWLEQMIVGSGYGSSSTIDVNARRFIFSENVYPALKKDTDRQLESIEYAPEAPMVQLKLTVGFQEYRHNPLLLSVGQGNNDWLKTLAARVSAQQLQDFAVTPGDKEKMKQLHFRVLSLIYYANVAYQLANPGVSAYQVVRQNLQALQKDYRAHAQDVTDDSYRSYIIALDSRITGVLLLLDILITALEKGRGVAPEAALAQLDRAIVALGKAEQQAIICTYNPLYAVPLQQGVQKDIMVAQIFRAIVKCYEVVTHTQSIEFGAFYDTLMDYVRALASIQSPDQVLGLLQSISVLLAARSGDDPVRILIDWSWLEPLVEGNRLKPTFGTPETVGNVICHYHPYWVAALNYAEKSGIIFKSGTGREALILVDATATGTPLVKHVLANDPNLPALQAGINTFNLLDKQTMALPALLSQDMAEKAMKAYASQNASQLGATIVKMIGLIYLPTAFVRYVGKNGNREILVSRLNLVNQNLTNLLMQTEKFLRQYGA